MGKGLLTTAVESRVSHESESDECLEAGKVLCKVILLLRRVLKILNDRRSMELGTLLCTKELKPAVNNIPRRQTNSVDLSWTRYTADKPLFMTP